MRNLYIYDNLLLEAGVIHEAGYVDSVHFTLFGKSSWLLHVDFGPHEELIYL